MSFGLSSPAVAGPPDPADDWGGIVGEAASRFGLPGSWIRAVMQAESGFNPRAVSPKGAMGLMQVMPRTYNGLRARYGLGADPYQPRDNVMAGAAYLRELYDRYGGGGFLAAYNAGPGRYEAYLQVGQPLPPETRNYVAALTPRVTGAVVSEPAFRANEATRPSLFVPLQVEVGRSRRADARPRSGVASPLFADLTKRDPGR